MSYLQVIKKTLFDKMAELSVQCNNRCGAIYLSKIDYRILMVLLRSMTDDDRDTFIPYEQYVDGSQSLWGMAFYKLPSQRRGFVITSESVNVCVDGMFPIRIR